GLLVLDITIPTQLTEIGRYFDGGKPGRVQVVDDLIYMTDADNGFMILEIGENQALTPSFELLLLVVGVAAIVGFGWWLKRDRTPSHAMHNVS
ncbi:MAG: hypothetical protein ACXABY_12090, partial [Candidatus Thorarchaeota archaeon]